MEQGDGTGLKNTTIFVQIYMNSLYTLTLYHIRARFNSLLLQCFYLVQLRVYTLQFFTKLYPHFGVNRTASIFPFHLK